MADDSPTIDEKPEPRIGSYRLVQPLGTGGMSSVFRALHAESGVEVAVKILPRNLARNRTLLQRFLREAKSAEALEHPNIVAIYDHGVDNGQYYLVLEYVSGGDLHDWVRKNGPMTVDQAVAVIRSVAEGLEFAAGQGLIHRDIKPANLLRTDSGTVKIADLGLALQAEAEDERVTREGTTVGTVDYMAPEQARDSRGTSERSDIYSLGCTFYFLLTGQPPFPGGDVTEKLTRHFTAPPPDPRDFRPDVPEELTRLIRKMMAKRPESRHANHGELIAALDALPRHSATTPGDTETLDALFDDDDAPEGDVPLYTLVGGAPPPPDPAPLYAVLDDDEPGSGPDSGGFRPLDLSEETGSTPVVDEPRMADISMADLASLDDDSPSSRVSRPPVRRPPSAPAVIAAVPEDQPLSDEDDEETLEGKMPGQISPGGPRMTDEERAWLKGVVFAAIGLFVGVIGFHQLWQASWSQPSTLAADNEGEVPLTARPAAVDTEPPPKSTSPKKSEVEGRGTPAPAVATHQIKPAPVASPPSPQLVWSEPSDPYPPSVAESVWSPEVEAKYRPDWAAADVPSRLPGKTLGVRRLPDPGDPDQKSGLRAAFEVIGVGTIEVSDNGPFFADDLRVAGEARLVRARPGYRPVVCLERPRLALALQKNAFIELDGKTLILDGLDLIVDAKELQGNLASIFSCRGGSLTLRNCTVTVINRNVLPFSVVQTGPADKTSRIRLERTLVRGSFSSVVELAAGAADLVISRSVVVNGHGAVLSSSGSWTGERRVFVSRSVLASRGPVFEMAVPPLGSRPRPLAVRALGSTFTHLPSDGRTSLLAWRGDGAPATEIVNWLGASNTYAGWSDWLAVGSAHSVRVLNLAAARAVWPGTDAKSEETSPVRPLSVVADRAGAAALRELSPDRPGVLSRVAVATAFLHERTVDSFTTPTAPKVAASGGGGSPAPPPPAPPVTTPTPGPVPASQSGVRELVFDAEGPSWSGDLGRFLASEVHEGDGLVRVRVTGSSQHTWTPVKLPEGVALELNVAPDTGGRSPSWSAGATTPAHALIDVSGRGISLNGLNLTRDGSSDLKRLIRVEGGHLVLHRCRLIATGIVEAGGGGLLEFNAPGSKPLPPVGGRTAHWPFESATDRPTCRVSECVLISGGEVLSAEIGRGLVAISQSAVAAGSSAFSLRPSILARHRLEADLSLDRCTVASEGAFVSLGPWLGSEPGPDRPWLVSTNRCVFFGTYDRRSQDSVLLRADPEAFAHGAIFWQGRFDAYEVPHFAVPSDSLLPANPRPDVIRQWVDLWGQDHIHGYSGPRPPAGTMTRWPVTRPLRPGDVQPGDLALDTAFPKDDSPRDLGVDLTRLGIAPTSRNRPKR